MKPTEHISQHILDVYEGGNWTESNMIAALKDVTVSEAALVTAATDNSIAALVHHLTIWNRVMVQRIKGIDIQLTDLNGFDVPVIVTETEWQNLQADSLKSVHELAQAIRSFDNDLLEQPILPSHSSAYKNLFGSSEHIHYHLGQIVLLKQLIRSLNVNSQM